MNPYDSSTNSTMSSSSSNDKFPPLAMYMLIGGGALILAFIAVYCYFVKKDGENIISDGFERFNIKDPKNEQIDVRVTTELAQSPKSLSRQNNWSSCGSFLCWFGSTQTTNEETNPTKNPLQFNPSA